MAITVTITVTKTVAMTMAMAMAITVAIYITVVITEAIIVAIATRAPGYNCSYNSGCKCGDHLRITIERRLSKFSRAVFLSAIYDVTFRSRSPPEHEVVFGHVQVMNIREPW